MSLFDALLNPAQQQQRAPSSGLEMLLGEAQKTAGMLGKNIGTIAGVDTRSPREKELAAVKKAIADAEGATIEEKLKNALPVIAQANPVLGIAFAEQLRGMAPPKAKITIRDVPYGPVNLATGNQKKATIRFRDGVPEAIISGDRNDPELKALMAQFASKKPKGGDPEPAPAKDKVIKVGAGQFVPKGSLQGEQVTAETGAAPQVEKQNTFPIPQRPNLQVEDIDSPRAQAVRPNVVMGMNEKSTLQLRARLRQLNKKGLLTPKERQELFEIQTELDKRK